MLFKREELKDILNGSSNRGQVMELIKERTYRNYSRYNTIFKYKHHDKEPGLEQRYKYYSCFARKKSSEEQRALTIQADGEEIDCPEVELKEIVVYKWLPKKRLLSYYNNKKKEDK